MGFDRTVFFLKIAYKRRLKQAGAKKCQAQNKLSYVYWLKCCTVLSLSSIEVGFQWGHFLLRLPSKFSKFWNCFVIQLQSMFCSIQASSIGSSSR
jgi:hypothetical protein